MDDETQNIENQEMFWQRTLSNLLEEINQFRGNLTSILTQAADRLPKQTSDQIEFHIELLFYHFDNLITHYQAAWDDAFAYFIADPIVDAKGNFQIKPELLTEVVFDSPNLRLLTFEFYSFILTAKIVLDKVHVYLQPYFKDTIPKSTTRFIEGKLTSDCNVYHFFQVEPHSAFLWYLVQLRDYLTHYKPFVASKRGYAVHEGQALTAKEREILSDWVFNPLMMQFAFLKQGIKFNILLPDQLFHGPDRKIKPFTYEIKLNLLSFLHGVLEACYDIYLAMIAVILSAQPKSFSCTPVS